MDDATRKSISKRLSLSNPSLWSKIPEHTQHAIVQLYFDTLGIGHVGMRSVLQDNANIRRNLATLYLGVLFGILGSMVADVFLKYLPHDWRTDVAIMVGFIVFSWWLIREFDKVLAEHLAADHILDHLYAVVAKDQDDSQK
jgi:hypothetical protein